MEPTYVMVLELAAYSMHRQGKSDEEIARSITQNDWDEAERKDREEAASYSRR